MTENQKGTILAEGKTKKIRSVPDWPGTVDIVSKDWLTAGDGARKHQVAGKGALATTTTVNVFRLLNDAGFRTHCREQIDAVTFRAWRLTMIPVEFVARGLATGSYLKRNPNVAKGTRFGQPVVELFLKDDERHDPMLLPEGGRWTLYDASKPISQDSRIGELPPDFFTRQCGGNLTTELTDSLTADTENVFLLLKQVWARQNIAIPDYKLEFGFNSDGYVMIGDVIDNDSWRLWPGGDPARELSKQRYRDAKEITPEILEEILSLYTQVAGRTHLFFNTN